jgi:hypothetical protein
MPVAVAPPPKKIFLDVRDYGTVVGNGIADDTAAIQAALAAALALPQGGTVVLSGRHGVTSDLVVGHRVSLIGGAGGSELIALSGGSWTRGMVRCGPYTVAGEGGIRYGRVSDIFINGADFAPVGLFVGLTVGRVFDNLMVRYCTQIGCTLDFAQNNNFTRCTFELNGSEPAGTWDTNLNIGDGSGSNVFLGLGLSGPPTTDPKPDRGRYNITYRQTRLVSGLPTNPKLNRIIGGVIERGRFFDAQIYHGNGQDNSISDAHIANGYPHPLGAACAGIRLRRDNTTSSCVSTGLVLGPGVGLQGNGTDAACDIQPDISSIVVLNGLDVSSYDKLYLINDNATIEVPNRLRVTTVPTWFSNTGTAVPGAGNSHLLDLRVRTPVRGVNTWNEARAGSDIAQSVGLTGEGYRLMVTGDGVIRLASDAPTYVATTPPSIRSGTGDPEGVVTARIGSLYIRTEGGVGATFYTKESGTGNTGWAPLIKAAQRDHGLPGQYLATPPFGTSLPSLTSNRAYLTRFQASRSIAQIAFVVSTAAGADDPCDVGIYDSTLTRIVSSGATTGKLNSVGVKTIPLVVTLTPGQIYYAGFAASLTGTAPVVVQASYGNTSVTQLWGGAAPNTLAHFKDTSYPLPATIASPGTASLFTLPASRDT